MENVNLKIDTESDGQLWIINELGSEEEVVAEISCDELQDGTIEPTKRQIQYAHLFANAPETKDERDKYYQFVTEYASAMKDKSTNKNGLTIYEAAMYKAAQELIKKAEGKS